jgi:GT2 family glycosyltransferase
MSGPVSQRDLPESGNAPEKQGVSVLCSNYNSARWIRNYCRCLNEQFLEKFDLIVVDAASTDGSLEVIKTFGFRPGISVTFIDCTERVSIYEAWNMATRAATTTYCLNFNTDDRLYPSALQTMMSYARAFPEIDIFYSRRLLTLNQDHLTVNHLFDYPEYSHEALLKECLCGPFPLWKRQTIIEAGLFDTRYRYSADHDMWLRLSKKGCRFKKIPEIIGSYFYNPEGMSTDVRTKQERILENETIQRLHSR